MAQQETYGTFTKKGEDDRVAYSPGDAVALRFNGWVEKSEKPQQKSSDAK